MKTLEQTKAALNAKSLEFADKAKTEKDPKAASVFEGMSIGFWFASAYVGAFSGDPEWVPVPTDKGLVLQNTLGEYKGVAVMWGDDWQVDDEIRFAK